MEPGQHAFKFSKIAGVQSQIYTEGYNFMIPWLERAVIYDVRTKPRVMEVTTGSAGKLNHYSLNLQISKRSTFR